MAAPMAACGSPRRSPTSLIVPPLLHAAVYLLVLAGLLLACDPSPPAETTSPVSVPAPSRPNVLLYVVDTLRADVLGAYGHPYVETPALDALARDGVLFENAQAASSWTRASMVSILTGLSSDLHGVMGREDVAEPGLIFLPERLRELGYRTGAIVTNPNAGRYFGLDQGYDEFLELYDHSGRGRVSESGSRASAGEVTARAIRWLDEAAAAADPADPAPRPFFLQILSTDPHAPYAPPDRFDRYAERPPHDPGGFSYTDTEQADFQRYLGEVAASDAAFGELLDHLRTTGRFDQTLIVFTADHGESFGEHRAHGHGNSLWNQVLRVPLVMRRPHEPEPGLRVAEAVSQIDVVPTILAIADEDRTQWQKLDPDARILPPRGDAAERSLYAQIELDAWRGEALLTPSHKFIRMDYETPSGAGHYERLFELADDPNERQNLQADQPELFAALERRLAERAQTSAGLAASLRDGSASDAATRNTTALPDDVRDALQALGYLDEAGAPSPQQTGVPTD